MITTVHVSITWAKPTPGLRDGGPVLRENPAETLSIKDPRVLLGVQQALARRTGVMQAPDLVSASGQPYFAVALNDLPGDGGNYTVTALLGWLTDPITLRICFAADGGWKTVLADIAVEVI